MSIQSENIRSHLNNLYNTRTKVRSKLAAIDSSMKLYVQSLFALSSILVCSLLTILSCGLHLMLLILIFLIFGYSIVAGIGIWLCVKSESSFERIEKEVDRQIEKTILIQHNIERSEQQK